MGTKNSFLTEEKVTRNLRIIHMYIYFKDAVRAHMERTAQKSVQDIVYTMNPVTTLMEPALTVVKMDT